ncbi:MULTISPECIES: hypothetical protein [Nitrosospira]|nr:MULTISPECIES: hypothetical protein [Nitrosospira]
MIDTDLLPTLVYSSGSILPSRNYLLRVQEPVGLFLIDSIS